MCEAEFALWEWGIALDYLGHQSDLFSLSPRATRRLARAQHGVLPPGRSSAARRLVMFGPRQLEQLRERPPAP